MQLRVVATVWDKCSEWDAVQGWGGAFQAEATGSYSHVTAAHQSEPTPICPLQLGPPNQNRAEGKSVEILHE